MTEQREPLVSLARDALLTRVEEGRRRLPAAVFDEIRAGLCYRHSETDPPRQTETDPPPG
jgi:hypothetical protein